MTHLPARRADSFRRPESLAPRGLLAVVLTALTLVAPQHLEAQRGQWDEAMGTIEEQRENKETMDP